MIVVQVKLVAVWHSINGVSRVNEVTVCRAWLILGWVTVHGYTNQTHSQTQPGHPLWVGKMSTGKVYSHRYGRTASPA